MHEGYGIPQRHRVPDRGEMGTGGTAQIRRKEAEQAAGIMGADLLKRVELGDTRVADAYENRSLVARVLRKYRPAIVLASHGEGPTDINSPARS